MGLVGNWESCDENFVAPAANCGLGSCADRAEHRVWWLHLHGNLRAGKLAELEAASGRQPLSKIQLETADRSTTYVV